MARVNDFDFSENPRFLFDLLRFALCRGLWLLEVLSERIIVELVAHMVTMLTRVTGTHVDERQTRTTSCGLYNY